MSVRVYCPICKGGKNVIWQGNLFDFMKETQKKNPPEWFNYSLRHAKAHNHEVMVSYPGLPSVPLRLKARRGVKTFN